VAHPCNPGYSGGKRSGGSQFKASLGKYFARPDLEKTHHKKRGQGAGGVTEGVSPEFKTPVPQNTNKKTF
jgi:hypothetical protein